MLPTHREAAARVKAATGRYERQPQGRRDTKGQHRMTNKRLHLSRNTDGVRVLSPPDDDVVMRGAGRRDLDINASGIVGMKIALEHIEALE